MLSIWSFPKYFRLGKAYCIPVVHDTKQEITESFIHEICFQGFSLTVPFWGSLVLDFCDYWSPGLEIGSRLVVKI